MTDKPNYQKGPDELVRARVAEAEYTILLFLDSLVEASNQQGNLKTQLPTIMEYLQKYAAFYDYRRHIIHTEERKDKGYGFTESKFLGTEKGNLLEQNINYFLFLTENGARDTDKLIGALQQIKFKRLVKAYDGGENPQEGILYKENYRHYKRQDYALAHTLRTIAMAGVLVFAIGAVMALRLSGSILNISLIVAGGGALLMAAGIPARYLSPRGDERNNVELVKKPMITSGAIKEMIYGDARKSDNAAINERMETCLSRYEAGA